MTHPGNLTKVHRRLLQVCDCCRGERAVCGASQGIDAGGAAEVCKGLIDFGDAGHVGDRKGEVDAEHLYDEGHTDIRAAMRKGCVPRWPVSRASSIARSKIALRASTEVHQACYECC